MLFLATINCSNTKRKKKVDEGLKILNSTTLLSLKSMLQEKLANTFTKHKLISANEYLKTTAWLQIKILLCTLVRHQQCVK
jgi:hypothetical protein